MVVPHRLLLKADGEDLSFVTVEIEDKAGVPVPNAGNFVRFSVSGNGTIAGVGSGSPVCLESFKGKSHTALNGMALCIVQNNGKKAAIAVTASAGGLQPASVQIVAQ